jgi:predicted CopG family antitoxin
MTKTIKISDDLYANLTIYAKASEQSVDVTAQELIEIGIATLDVQLAVKRIIKK